MVGEQHGLSGLRLVLSCPDGGHACLENLRLRVNQSLPPLVDAVVVRQIQVGHPMPLQVIQPFRLCPEDILFEHRGMDLGSRAFQIAHHSIGGTEHGVDLR